MAKEILLPEGFEVDKIVDGKIILKETEKGLPNTWEEWVEQNPVINKEYGIDGCCSIFERGNAQREDYSHNLLPTKELCEAILALIKIIRLRDTYRQGWKPDWCNYYITKSAISFNSGEAIKGHRWNTSEILSFQSEEIRDKFYENFKDLIEKVKLLYE